MTAPAALAITFDSAHEPPEIQNPGVQTGSSDEVGPVYFFVTLSFTLTCPGLGGPSGDSVPYTVAFSRPEGTTSLSLGNGCEGKWNPVPEAHGLELTPNDGALSAGSPSLGLPPTEVGKPELWYTPKNSGPFLWQVIAPTGTVVAQGTEYVTVESQEPLEVNERSEIDAFINVCIDGNLEIHSKENGNLYCVIEPSSRTSFVAHHWPAPPQLITATTAPRWAKAAVLRYLRTAPQRFGARGCTQRATGRYRCAVTWRLRSRSYSGWVEVGGVNRVTGAFRYGLRVTEASHGRRRLRTVHY